MNLPRTSLFNSALNITLLYTENLASQWFSAFPANFSLFFKGLAVADESGGEFMQENLAVEPQGGGKA